MRYFVGPLCPPADDRTAFVPQQQPESSPLFDLGRVLHAASALTQGVIIGTILSTFPVLQTLDAAFFRPIGICHNAYLVIILVAIRRWQPDAGIGTLIALLVPYCIAALVTWTAFLVAWESLGIPLGPG